MYVYVISLCYFTPVDPWRVNEDPRMKLQLGSVYGTKF